MKIVEDAALLYINAMRCISSLNEKIETLERRTTLVEAVSSNLLKRKCNYQIGLFLLIFFLSIIDESGSEMDSQLIKMPRIPTTKENEIQKRNREFLESASRIMSRYNFSAFPRHIDFGGSFSAASIQPSISALEPIAEAEVEVETSN